MCGNYVGCVPPLPLLLSLSLSLSHTQTHTGDILFVFHSFHHLSPSSVISLFPSNSLCCSFVWLVHSLMVCCHIDAFRIQLIQMCVCILYVYELCCAQYQHTHAVLLILVSSTLPFNILVCERTNERKIKLKSQANIQTTSVFIQKADNKHFKVLCFASFAKTSDFRCCALSLSLFHSLISLSLGISSSLFLR